VLTTKGTKKSIYHGDHREHREVKNKRIIRKARKKGVNHEGHEKGTKRGVNHEEHEKGALTTKNTKNTKK
jgi:hypothetical protein